MGKKDPFELFLNYTKQEGIVGLIKKVGEIGEGEDLQTFFEQENLKKLLQNHLLEKEKYETVIPGNAATNPHLKAVKKKEMWVEGCGWSPTTNVEELLAGSLKLLGAKGENSSIQISLGISKLETYSALIREINWIRKNMYLHVYVVDGNGKKHVSPRVHDNRKKRKVRK